MKGTKQRVELTASKLEHGYKVLYLWMEGTMAIELQQKGLRNNAACFRESGKVSKGAGHVSTVAIRSKIARGSRVKELV